MRLAAILLLTACLQVSARGYAQLSISERNSSLEKIFKVIERQSGYVFFYDYALLKQAKTVSIKTKNASLTEVLDLCFKEQPLSYAIVGKTVVVKSKELAATAPTEVAVLEIPVTGTVTDAATGNPLTGASVNIKGSSNGVVTGPGGEFSINLPNNGAVLTISYVGYEPFDIRVSKASALKIKLQLKDNKADEVVVIGYGTRRRKDVTGAVSTVSSAEISKNTSMTPELALQGKAAGVFIESGGGDPAARPTVRIRGVNTFGFAEPLYVIDGLPIFEGGAGVTGGAIGDIRSPLNIFSMINPADIESMSVLKDASAAAIYGVRASNGVIIITTKRGKSGRPGVELTGSYGIQNIPKSIKTLNTQEYFTLLKEAYANNPDANTSFAQKFGPLYDANNAAYVGNGPTYNWDKELRNKNAPMRDVSARVSGGNDNTTYYFSAGYTKTESPLKANNLQRYTVATNLDARISKYISAGLNLRLIQQDAYENTGGDLGTMMATIPFQPIYSATDPSGFTPVTSGSFVVNPAFDPTKLDAGAPFVFAPGDPKLIWGQQSRYNIFAQQQLSDNRYQLMNALGNAYLQIEPITGLKLKGSLGGQYYTNLRKSWSDFSFWRFSQTPGNPYAGQDGNAKGRYGEREGRTYNLNKELSLTYTHTFKNDHGIDILLNASDQFSSWHVNDLSGNVNYTDLQYRGISNQPPYTSGLANILQEDALIGYLGRLSYKFKDKYYFDATVRRDGSSRLAPGKKWETFPSFAAAWRISSEKFFPVNSFVNDLKIRGGWGRLGNFQSASPYQFLSNVSLSSDYSIGSGNGNAFGSQNQGATLPNFANTTLTWEKVRTSSIGFDAVLLHNRFTITAEYYSKTTYDIIQSVALPPNTGIEQPANLNVAQVSNKGIELQLGYNTKLGGVNLNFSGNITTVKNRIEKLNGGSPIGDEFGRIEEGYSMFYLWGYKVGGIFQDQASINAWKAAHPKGDANVGGYTYKPGDMYFQDVYGNPAAGSKARHSNTPDSLVNSNDRTYLGKTIPGYYYGFSAAAEWNGFDLSIFFQGVGDVQKYNRVRAGLEAMSGAANQWATTLNRWTAGNPSATMPRAVFGDPGAFNRVSDRYVENASYLRLKNLQIGYKLPSSLINKTKVAQNLRLYVSAVNLFTVTKYKGLDPENDIIPVTRQFLVGITASF
ncbi:MAG TPA: TonB-dependent receptor [Chitinophagaceae bacterium]|nr:TonB-dependent receptor [Chitinophagaceae bacterium]